MLQEFSNMPYQCSPTPWGGGGGGGGGGGHAHPPVFALVLDKQFCMGLKFSNFAKNENKPELQFGLPHFFFVPNSAYASVNSGLKALYFL